MKASADVAALSAGPVEDSVLRPEAELDLGPELGHRAFDVRRDLARGERSAIGFAVEAEPRLAENAGHRLEEIVAVEVGDRPAEVVAEARGLVLASDDTPRGENGQKLAKGVTAARLEFSGHRRRPRGRAGLVAVEQDVRQARADEIAEMLLHFADDAVEMELDRRRVHLVALKSAGLPLVRLRHCAHRRMREAVDLPRTRRRSPLERTVRLKTVGQVENGVLRHDAVRRERQDGDVAPVVGPRWDLGLLEDALVLVDHRKQHVAARIDPRKREAGAERLAALDGGAGAEDLAHCEFRRNPGTARRRVAGAVVESDADARPPRFCRGKSQKLPPGVGKRDETLRRRIRNRRGPRRADVGHAEDRRLADAGVAKGFEIARDAVLRDVAAHPVPPDAGLGVKRRMAEDRLGVVRGEKSRGHGDGDGG